MLNALSPKPLELLRAVRESPTRSVKSLAERLGRDYKRVHEDVVGDLDGMSERVKQGTPGDEYWLFFNVRPFAIAPKPPLRAFEPISARP
jgi:hypothetical protein